MIEGMDAVILSGDEATEIMGYIRLLRGFVPHRTGADLTARMAQDALSDPRPAVDALGRYVDGRAEFVRQAGLLRDVQAAAEREGVSVPGVPGAPQGGMTSDG